MYWETWALAVEEGFVEGLGIEKDEQKWYKGHGKVKLGISKEKPYESIGKEGKQLKPLPRKSNEQARRAEGASRLQIASRKCAPTMRLITKPRKDATSGLNLSHATLP